VSAGNIFLFGFIAGATSQITRSGYLGLGSGSRTSLPWFISHIICLFFFFSFSTPLIPNRRISRGCVVYCESLCKQKWKQKKKKQKKDKKENFTCCRSCRPYPPPPLSPFPTTLHPLSLRLLYCTGRKQNHLLESHQVD
jgi:hypothetical protein